MNKNNTLTSSVMHVCRTPSEIYENIKDFHSEGFTEQYMKNFGLDLSTTKEHFHELLKFLSIGASGSTDITPSEQLDETWHALIIQTADYQLLSEKIGVFLHHTTTDRPQKDNYRNVINLYQQFFGTPHEVWELPNLNKVKVHTPDGDCHECDIVGWCGMGS